jgi:hypothetical protein
MTFPPPRSIGIHSLGQSDSLSIIHDAILATSCRHEEDGPMAKVVGVGSVADQLKERGMKGVLVKMAEDRLLLAMKCEMPLCYHPEGRGSFDKVTSRFTPWAPSPDHYPVPAWAKGKKTPDNIRLSHSLCNNRDYGWRSKIKAMLKKGMALNEIAAALNQKKVEPAYRAKKWTAAMVRRAYVS